MDSSLENRGPEEEQGREGWQFLGSCGDQGLGFDVRVWGIPILEQELVENVGFGGPQGVPSCGLSFQWIERWCCCQVEGRGGGKGALGRPKCHLHGGPCPGGAVALRASTLCGWGGVPSSAQAWGIAGGEG